MTKRARSQAAKKAWAARKERAARRSAAAKKGWETRRRRAHARVKGSSAKRARSTDWVLAPGEDFEDLADRWGVDVADVEALMVEADFDEDEAFTRDELDDYLNELADLFDIDISDLYDMWYGYEPGSKGR